MLVMNCETDIPIDDTVALRNEVNEIWDIFRVDVESSKREMGAIRISQHPGSGILTVSKGYGFVFEKQKDGHWKCLEDDKRK
jgi:hypothetical protein